jgi:SAM-dependent methyltransferase
MIASLGLYAWYWASWIRYARMPSAEKLRLIDGYPCLGDRTKKTPFDAHYVFQAVWAMEHIAQSGDQHHIDVGSDVRFVTMLTTHLPVTFVDIRPLKAKGIKRLTSIAGSLLELPFADASVKSLSCLHVAEHVGLGRYGDPLDPSGTRRACAELARVLAPGGNLFFSLPVGRSRVCFNAHRVHTPAQILDYFRELELIAFAVVDDRREFLSNILPSQMAVSEYGCGMFWFQRNPG